MEFRLWIGLWTSLMLFLLAMFNLSFLVRSITRFTEECFAGLVASIFIIDALMMTLKLKQFQGYQMDERLTDISGNLSLDRNRIINTNLSYSELSASKQETVFYFSLILFIMSFMICVMSKEIQTKRYLTTKVSLFWTILI